MDESSLRKINKLTIFIVFFNNLFLFLLFQNNRFLQNGTFWRPFRTTWIWTGSFIVLWNSPPDPFRYVPEHKLQNLILDFILTHSSAQTLDRVCEIILIFQFIEANFGLHFHPSYAHKRSNSLSKVFASSLWYTWLTQISCCYYYFLNKLLLLD